MHYTVLGSGAMGLRFGVLLQETGQQVDFVDDWDPQVEAIKKQGGVYVTRDGQNRHLVNINISYPEDYTGKPDAYIIMCKQMGLQEMLTRCAHFFQEGQYAITLMNGMGHIEKINQYFDPKYVIAGTAMIGTVLTKPGEVDFIGKKHAGSLHLVNQTEKPDDFTHKVIDEWDAAGTNPGLTTNFIGTLLTKVIYNSVVNTLSSMFRLRQGQFISADVAPTLVDKLVKEAYEVFDAAGIKPIQTKEEATELIYHETRDLTPNHYSSMFQDIRKNRPTEVDYINGYLYDLGQKNGYNAVTHDFLRDVVHLAEHANNILNAK
ncbi:ketopantoate reductase family protein [Secundilactobacillus mixtipabuli]|nr:ketopantoate reductase family protein [Secundilactobacillus mixtipabuli]